MSGYGYPATDADACHRLLFIVIEFNVDFTRAIHLITLLTDDFCQTCSFYEMVTRQIKSEWTVCRTGSRVFQYASAGSIYPAMRVAGCFAGFRRKEQNRFCP